MIKTSFNLVLILVLGIIIPLKVSGIYAFPTQLPFSNIIPEGDSTVSSDFTCKPCECNYMIKPNHSSVLEPGIESGVSGAFTGILNGYPIFAGGCNFPSNPLDPDSKKVFYSGIYKLVNIEGETFTPVKIGELPSPIAYGSYVNLPDGILIMGGMNSSEGYANVFKLHFIKDEDLNEKIMICPFPDLPFNIDNAFATCLDNLVFIAGGYIEGLPSNRVFKLDLNEIEKGWEELEPFPGNPRVQPVLASGKDIDNHPYLYLWGGFCPKVNDREATLNTDGLIYDVILNKWEPIKGPKDFDGSEISVGGAASTILSDGRIVIAGGVNKDIFLDALKNQSPDYLYQPVEWYRFNPNILVFDPKDKSWAINSSSSQAARAGAGMVSDENNEVLIIGGEIKPRIRTSDTFRIKID